MINMLFLSVIAAPAPIYKEFHIQPETIVGRWNYKYSGCNCVVTFNEDYTMNTLYKDQLYSGVWRLNCSCIEIMESRSMYPCYYTKFNVFLEKSNKNMITGVANCHIKYSECSHSNCIFDFELKRCK